MTIDKAKLKELAQAVIDLEDPWYTVPHLTVRAVDAAPAALMASLTPEVVMALLAEIESLQEHKQHLVDLRETNGFESWAAALVEIDRLKAENESLRESANFRAIQSLRGDCEELRKDAERYRWLKVDRRPAAELDAAFNTYGVPVDEAIDAAMAKGDH